MSFFARLIASALGLAAAAYIIPGFHIHGIYTLIIAALLLGIVNAFIRPIVIILALPIEILTLGLFLFVINAGMIALVAWILPGFSIDGFWAAFFGWLIVSIVSWAASQIFKGIR